ncbi:O-antigen ligase family protein [Gordonia polyisoprenivorans]|uniref:O-antigen ligase family protein n=1 Tax=Gordonia polyisoprenivorans TaxID=84595 RepID=UPI0012DF30F5|nr:O-antigen ligase family protein [Gordonia polyisoprenivorans]
MARRSSWLLQVGVVVLSIFSGLSMSFGFRSVSVERWNWIVCSICVVSIVASSSLLNLESETFVLVSVLIVILISLLTVPFAIALLLLLAGPVLFSVVDLGPLTLDNAVVVLGSLIALSALWLRGGLPWLRGVFALFLYPVMIAVSVVLSGFANGVPWVVPVFRFVSLALTVLVAARCSGRVRFAIVRLVLAIGVLSVLVQPIVGFPDAFSDFDGSVRFGGLFGHPNFASYVIGSFIVFSVAGKSWRTLDVLLCCAGAVAMLLASSQTAILVLVAALSVALIRYPVRAFICFVGAFVVVIMVGGTFTSRIAPLMNTWSFSSSKSGSWRVGQWQSSLDLARGWNPFGVGWQQTKVLLPDGLGVHSGFVGTYVELGLFGCFVVSMALCQLMFRLRSSTPALLVWIYLTLCAVTDPSVFYPSCVAVGLCLGVQGLCDGGNHNRLESRAVYRRFLGSSGRVCDVPVGDLFLSERKV